MDSDSVKLSEHEIVLQVDGRSNYKYPVSAKDAPSYMLYPGVLNKYRVGGSYADCLKSFFQFHTESVNIWTVFASLIFSIIATTICLSTGIVPVWSYPAFIIFTSSSIIHTPFSVGFHLFMPINIKVFNLWRRLDVVAIFVGSSLFAISLSYVVFPWWGIMIMGFVVSSLSLVASINFWTLPDDHALDNTRHAMFVGSIIICYWIPMLYSLISEASKGLFPLSSGMVIGEVFSIMIGGCAFAFSLPQKYAQGKFDVFGHSHQMLHVAAMVAHACKFVFIFSRSKGSHNI